MVCFEREKKTYIAGLGRDQLEHLANPMPKSETSPSPITNESKTSPRRGEKRLESGIESKTGLEYYSSTT